MNMLRRHWPWLLVLIVLLALPNLTTFEHHSGMPGT